MLSTIDTWNAFQRALERHQRAPSAESEASVIDAHRDWVTAFAPEAPEILIAEFRDRLRRSGRAA